MIKLYSLLFILLFVALTLIALPFIKNKSYRSKSFIGTIVFSIIFTVSLYQLTSNSTALKTWLTTGQQHYQLAEEVNQLGGIDNIILKIKQRLAENPNDVSGWLILSKIYRAQHNDIEADKALARAQEIR
jgi:cytochrome c-type biogenesis protein CcmH/NrfG